MLPVNQEKELIAEIVYLLNENSHLVLKSDNEDMETKLAANNLRLREIMQILMSLRGEEFKLIMSHQDGANGARIQLDINIQMGLDT